MNFRDFHDFHRAFVLLRCLQWEDVEEFMSPDEFKRFHLSPYNFFAGAPDEMQLAMFDIVRKQMQHTKALMAAE